jgi:hypothetical protein
VFFIGNSRNEGGIPFSLEKLMKRKGNFSILASSLFRSVVDTCILPGTSNGTEILLLYVRQWSKEVSIVSIAVLSMASMINSSSNTHMTSQQTVVEPDNHI